jgi:hypothetical protein
MDVRKWIFFLIAYVHDSLCYCVVGDSEVDCDFSYVTAECGDGKLLALREHELLRSANNRTSYY